MLNGEVCNFFHLSVAIKHERSIESLFLRGKLVRSKGRDQLQVSKGVSAIVVPVKDGLLGQE